MQLGESVRQLSDLIWQLEQRKKRPLEDAILAYVRDAVTTEIEYRRRLNDLDRKLAELESIEEATTVA